LEPTTHTTEPRERPLPDPGAAPGDARTGRPLPGASPPDATGRRLERAVLVSNLIFLGIAAVLLVLTGLGSGTRVEPLVGTDTRTSSRMEQLERALQRDPGNVAGAVELARLYGEAGEFPWSYDALRTAEQTGTLEPSWRLRLGLAYLEIGKSADGLRLLKEAKARCAADPACPAPVRVKLDLFTRVAQLYVDRGIDARRHRVAAEKALREVLKPVTVDPAKMRPKGPAAPTTSTPPTTSAGSAAAGKPARPTPAEKQPASRPGSAPPPPPPAKRSGPGLY